MHQTSTEKEVMRAAQAALEKKALDVIVFDIRGISDMADYFLICSGTNEKQIRAIADAVEKALLEINVKMNHKEGYEDSSWILLDYGDIVVHIFDEEKRQYYDLERLWGDAPRVDLSSLDFSAQDKRTLS